MLESNSNMKELHEFPPGPLHIPSSFAVAKDKQGLGQQQLLNVLRAYSIFNAEVGYCKGLRRKPPPSHNAHV